MEIDRLNILIVEDEESHAELIKRGIYDKDPSSVVQVAVTIADAKEYLVSEKPSILITDWKLPDGDGIELLKTGLDEFPVIIMTSYGNETIAVEAIKSGAIDYVVKSPDILSDMYRIIIRVLREWDNISRRRIAEEALKQSEDRYRSLVENSNDWILELDASGRYLYNSPHVKDILGYEPYELKGKMFTEFMKPHEADRVMEEYNSHIAKGLTFNHMEISYLHRDGRNIIIEGNATPLFNKEGVPIGYRAINRDITERKRLEDEKHRFEAQLQHTQKLESLGILAGGIAHDFNNLLMAILGNAELALLEIPSSSPIRERLLDIENASRRASDLCKQMLAYSGKGKFDIKPIKLDEIVKEMSYMLEVSISKKAILRYDFSHELPAIKADPTQIRQIIMNLIINASEAIGDKNGVISLSTGSITCRPRDLKETYLSDDIPEGQYVYLEVSDNGCGMDKETMSKVFDPFFTTKFTGRGLGLAAVIGIVRGHKGAIRVESEKGKGTVFKILFPVIDIPPEKNDKPEKKVDFSSRGTVLLVDDDKMALETGKRLIKKLGFNVLTASDGFEAIQIFCDDHMAETENKITCIILDLTMPYMDGVETFHELNRLNSNIPVILSSGYNEQELTGRFKEKWPAGFIQKPYGIDLLMNKFREILG